MASAGRDGSGEAGPAGGQLTVDSLDLGTQERSGGTARWMDRNGGKGRELPPFVQHVKVTKHSHPCLHVAVLAPPSRTGVCPGAGC